MQIRTDLLKFVTAEDVLAIGLENQHRFSAEPVFSKRGTGHLSATSTEDSAKMEKQATELRRKLTTRSKKAGKTFKAGKQASKKLLIS